ncbi:hypothetical protein ACET3Z_001545 [Daucus carota]
MDDSCAVCAETLEWTAYGQCGHREVCSTCVARLRFICDDQNCCICKSNLETVFVTKAQGDYTSMIRDFSVFPSEPKEGKAGSYWYHEGTHAFFDDPDQYKTVKAMCKLSCIICDKVHQQGNGNTKRYGNFKNIDQLKDHLSCHHKLVMCNLCLEGRKIFICEQKLYTKEQLNQHINTGDSEVDGSEAERGGFMGHPMCEFCRNPFYGENELYTHMSTEHYTCHICQRQHPGHFEYYRNYDELEIHFRGDHMLCEDEGCLTKKFIVFATESEMKRHNAMEHGGRMSRSKRNAVLQIPTSFRYERNTEQDRHRRGRSFHPDHFDIELSRAVQASLEPTNANIHHASSSGFEVLSSIGAAAENDSKFRPLELLSSSREFEPSSSHHHQQGRNARNVPLEESSFPPLPVSTKNNQQNLRSKGKGSGKNTMAARLRRHNNVAVLHSAQAGTRVNLHPTASSSSGSKSRLTTISGHKSSFASSSSSLGKPASESILVRHDNAIPGNRTLADYVSVSAGSDRSSSTVSGSRKVNHSASEPNLLAKGSYSSNADFPPVSLTKTKDSAANNQLLVKVEETKAANKSLVQRIRAGLLFDEDRYTIFKIISGEYRQGVINTGEYVAYVHQFGLSHLLSELAKLCPDAQKQKELLEASKINLVSSSSSETSADMVNRQLKEHKTSRKGKEKLVGVETSINPGVADNLISSAKVLHSGHRPPEEGIEILEKDGYRSMKGKSKVSVADGVTNSGSSIMVPVENTLLNDYTSSSSSKKIGEGNKPRKKTSKFHRVRLGEDSPAALLGLGHSESTPDLSQQKPSQSNERSRKLAVGGVWQNGGGKKLVAILR